MLQRVQGPSPSTLTHGKWSVCVGIRLGRVIDSLLQYIIRAVVAG